MKKRQDPGPSPEQLERIKLALTLHQSGRLADAAAHYRVLLQVMPANPLLLTNLGNIALQQGQTEEGVELLGKSVRIDPKQPQALNNRGNALRHLRRLPEALASFDLAIAQKPDYAAAYSNRAALLKDMRQLEAALVSVDRALVMQPDSVSALINRSAILLDLGRAEDALAGLERALMLDPDNFSARVNRAHALRELQRSAEALQIYDEVLQQLPQVAEVHSGRGAVLLDLKRLEESLVSIDRALALHPNYVDALFNRACVLGLLHREQEALATYDAVIAMDPRHAKAYSNRGALLYDAGFLDPALASLDCAIGLQPELMPAHVVRTEVLLLMGRLQEGLTATRRILEMKPDQDYVAGNCLSIQQMLCDWQDFDAKAQALAAKVRGGAKVVMPQKLLAISDEPALQRCCAEIWAAEIAPAEAAQPIAASVAHERIRIGYFSGDYREHPVALLSAGIFEHHDRNRFEITAFSFGPDSDDPMRSRLQSAFTRFLDVHDLSDRQVVELARELEIDIAVDMTGYTRYARTGIFGRRAAPLQLAFLGFAGTMGADYMDYLVADTTVVPESGQQYYSENMLYLPHSFMPNDDRRLISAQVLQRQDFGLPATAFVFCCFNNSYKISPDTFSNWMRILASVADSVLWLSVANTVSRENLRRAAEQHGVSAHRLIFATHMPSMAEHLARLRLGDLFLDTLPYNAHTTACDALWAGLPVLTCQGRTFAARVAASLLKAVGLPELVTDSSEAYQALAIELAVNPQKLTALRHRLAENRLKAPLFDTAQYTRHLEAGFAAIYARHRAGEGPAHIYVRE